MSITKNKVLVTGASGYIGVNVCNALLEKGYTVYAVFRSVGQYERVKGVIGTKVRAIVADPNTPWLLKAALEKCFAVIDCCDHAGTQLAIGLVNELVKSGKGKLFVWTTGVANYGKNEDEVLARNGADVTTCVIRPAFTYGGIFGAGAAIGPLLFPGPNDKVTVGGKRDKKWPWVHAADLAATYVRAVSHPEKVGKQRFLVGDLTGAPTYEQVRVACAQAAGNTTAPVFGAATGFEAAIDLDISSFDNASAKAVLGFANTHKGIVAEAAETYKQYAAKPAPPAPKPARPVAVYHPPAPHVPEKAPAAAAAAAAPAAAAAAGKPAIPVVSGVADAERTLLIFPGQGAQKVGMAAGLDAQYPEVKDMFAKAKEILGYDLLSVCVNGPEDKLNTTLVSQPALYVASMAALAKCRKDDAARFKGCVVTCGLSLGEYTALAHAGVFSFEDGLRLVKARAEAMQAAAEASKSGMVSVLGATMTEQKVHELAAAAAKATNSQCYVSNVLCLGNTTISGSIAACEEVMKLGEKFGATKTVKLNVAGAFHSEFMRPAFNKLKEVLEKITFKVPTIPVIMNVDGLPEADPVAIKAKLLEQLVKPVLWEKSIEHCLDKYNLAHVVEVGPGNILTGLMRRILKESKIAKKPTPKAFTV